MTDTPFSTTPAGLIRDPLLVVVFFIILLLFSWSRLAKRRFRPAVLGGLPHKPIQQRMDLAAESGQALAIMLGSAPIGMAITTAASAALCLSRAWEPRAAKTCLPTTLASANSNWYAVLLAEAQPKSSAHTSQFVRFTGPGAFLDAANKGLEPASVVVQECYDCSVESLLFSQGFSDFARAVQGSSLHPLAGFLQSAPPEQAIFGEWYYSVPLALGLPETRRDLAAHDWLRYMIFAAAVLGALASLFGLGA